MSDTTALRARLEKWLDTVPIQYQPWLSSEGAGLLREAIAVLGPQADSVDVAEHTRAILRATMKGFEAGHAHGLKGLAIGESEADRTAAAPAPEGLAYDFDHEARQVCDAIASNVGWMTVKCALHEAYNAGRARPALSDEVLREMAQAWLGSDVNLEYAVDCFRAVLARQQESR